MQKLIVALTLLFGGIAANDRDGHSRLLRGRGKTVDHDAGDEPATVQEGIPPECVLAFEAVTKDGNKLKDFPACIDNFVVVTEAVLNKPESFADAGPDARDSILIQMIAKNRKSDTVIPFDDEETFPFKSSDVFALPAVAKDGRALADYPESKNNLIVVMQAVLKTPNAFQFAGCDAQSDLLIQLVATGLSPANLDLVQQGCGEPTPAPTPKPTAQPTAAPELNGCGQPCAAVVTLDESFEGTFELEENKCYVVDGYIESTTSGDIAVQPGVNCVKLTVPSGSGLSGTSAHLPRPSFAPRNAKTRRAQIRGINTEIINEGELNTLGVRLPRPMLLMKALITTTSRRSLP